MTKIYLHTLANEDVIAWSGESFRELLTRLINDSSDIAVCASPAEANLILLLEKCVQKGRTHADKLLADPVIAQHAPKVCTLNIDDHPVPFLPGGYVNLPRTQHRADTVATGYLMVPNERVTQWAKQRHQARTKLATFRGSINCPAREQLFALRDSFGDEVLIEKPPADAWYNHTIEAKDNYCQELLAGHFALCPGGLGPSTYRLYEAMQLERAPIILSDRWAPPDVVDWSQCAITLPEKGIKNLCRVFDGRLPEADALAAQARQAWEQYFAPEKQIVWIIEKLSAVIKSGAGKTADGYRRHWNREAFWAQHGLARHQQILRRAKKLLGR
ncbi:exostosin domain-containing protein [Cerasicoccus maritimus]|uniref:exostosin domain-containing protein n=1 Tax=Cerasicoccus maritimus TaxID=490089 RepID=UPI002852C92B|nr:exostosin family protein [Cerasicoccus maritimus]